MQKITYRYSALSKQTWFYAGALYLALLSAVYILVAACRLEGYYERMNLTVNLLANGAGMAFFLLLSLGHHVCASEYDAEQITYRNRLLKRSRSFRYEQAEVMIFDRRGVKFYADEEALLHKEKPDFYVPFFRDGKVDAVQLDHFFKLMKSREAKLAEKGACFKVYKTFKVVPGYGRRWKYLSFAYACLTLLVLMNCTRPLAAIMGILSAF